MKQISKPFGAPAILFFSFLLGLASCDDKPNDELTLKEKQLTAKEWKITDITRLAIEDPTQDSSILKTCTSDDRLYFNTNKAFQLNDKEVKCDSTIFFYDNGNWNMNTAQDQVTLTGAKRTQVWKIITLNDTIMKVQWRDSTSTTSNVLKTISLKNK